MLDLCAIHPRQRTELRQHVRRTLCEIEQLEPETHAITESVLQRGGAPCGVLFCVFGPRQVRLTAVWEFDQDVIRYYDSAGARFRTAPRPSQRRVRLAEEID